MNDMCGIRPCFVLSGLTGLLTTLTQGVALGWFVVAPSGRSRARVRLCLRTFVFAFAILLFSVGLPSFAASSPLADAAEKSDRATLRTLLKQRA